MDQETARQIVKWRLVVMLMIIPCLILIVRPFLWPGGFGFGEDQSTTSTIEKDPNGLIIKNTETTSLDRGKTFWDWLGLLGVPISLLLLGSFLQKLDQEKLIKQQDQDEKNAKDLQRQKALKDYFNEVEALLLDQDWNSQSSRSDKIKILLRAKILEVLGELDGRRKGSLVKFLIESKIIDQYPHLLKSADLSEAQLFGVDLSGADLSAANLEQADLFVAVLARVDFTGSNLIGADLRGALLYNSKFDAAILAKTDLKDANLSSESQLEASSPASKSPYLCNARLPDSFYEKASLNRKFSNFNRMRDCQEIPEILVRRGYFKNIDEAREHVEGLSKASWSTD